MMQSPWGAFPDQSTLGLNLSTTQSPQLTASATPNVKGAYAQLIASSPFDAVGFWLYMYSYSTDSLKHFLVDLALGAAASEVNFITNIWRPQGFSNNIWIPYAIAAGQRISGRCQCEGASFIVRGVAMTLMSQTPQHPDMSCSECIFDTADTAASAGTNLAAAGATNTKTGWTQLIASTTRSVKYLIVQASTASQATSGPEHIFDIGIGAAASELVLIPDQFFTPRDFGAYDGGFERGYWVDIPAASRLSARHQCATTADAMKVNLIGLG